MGAIENNLAAETGVSIPARRRRPLLRNLRVQLRALLDGYHAAARCRGDLARARFSKASARVQIVHEQAEFSSRKKAQEAQKGAA